MRSTVALALFLCACGKEAPPPEPGDERVLEGPFTGLRVDASPDLTGDGVPDLLVSSPGLDGSGAVFVHSGRATGELTGTDALASFVAAAPGDVGTGLAACGDVDGDGARDLLLGAPEADDGRGFAWLLLGPLSGALGPSDATRIATVPAARAGATVACLGDTDGDGLHDLVVTAPEADGFGAAKRSGLVTFLRVTGEGPDAFASLSNTFSDSRLGTDRSLLWADLDGDGFDEAIVGAPGASRVHVAPGPITGTFDPNAAGVTFRGTHDGTGTAIAVGDLDGDGDLDLVIGAPGHAGGLGRVAILDGPIDPTGTTPLPAARWITGQDHGERVGASLAVGDLDGDGIDDLVIGAPGAVTSGPEGGVAYVLRGPVKATAVHGADGTIVGETAWGALGTSVAIVPDVDGDGDAELLVGAPHTDVGDVVGAGAAWLVLGPVEGQVATGDAAARITH